MVGGGRPGDRCWRFAGAEFDEASWTLSVGGERVSLENKPLRLLRALLDQPGQVVGKDALLEAVWPGVIVVEGSLTTAMNKLRRALGDRDARIIETVPGIGYRLAVPADMAPPRAATVRPDVATAPDDWLRWAIAAGAAALLAAAGLVVLGRNAPPDRLEIIAAMRALDVPALRMLIGRGWNPAVPMGSERNTSIGMLLEICEWNPAHDRQKLALAVRLLLDAGARPTDRNVWGDTPYSIANAPRYCGPDHPATRLLRTVCTGSRPAIDPRCLADYRNSAWPQVTPPAAG